MGQECLYRTSEGSKPFAPSVLPVYPGPGSTPPPPPSSRTAWQTGAAPPALRFLQPHLQGSAARGESPGTLFPYGASYWTQLSGFLPALPWRWALTVPHSPWCPRTPG